MEETWSLGLTSAGQLADTVVKKNPDGSHVRLADLAEVEEGFEKRRMSSRHNGRRTIVLGISKDADTDIIRRALESLPD